VKPTSGDPATVLFVMGSPEYLRYYDSTLELLAERGHRVAVAVNSAREKKFVGLEGLQVLAGRVQLLGVAPAPAGTWRDIAHEIRGVMDFVRYLHPRFVEAPALRARMKRKALHPAFHWLDAIRTLPPWAVRRVLALLALCERAVPVDPAIVQFVDAVRPDVVLLSPVVDAASDQVEFIKAARRLGIPSAACIASWDNLTNKGVLRLQPDRVLVWNEAQRREAVEYHGARPERVVVTGAQLFDRWFAAAPSTTRADFCQRTGLPNDAPFVLFTGSSSFIAESGAEVEFVRRWAERLRSHPDPLLRDVNILVRPHPYNCHAWSAADLSAVGAAVYPRMGLSPVDASNRAVFYDSLYHSAAVVGINTTAMIEAAIIGRPVLSIHAQEFAATQEGTLHFHHLLPENGGCVHVAGTLDRHVEQLAGLLRAPEAARAQTRRFVASFVRPHGVDRPATPIVADAIEEIAASGRRTPERAPIWRFALLPGLLVVAAVASAIGLLVRPAEAAHLRKRARRAQAKAAKRARRAVAVGGGRLRSAGRRVAKRTGRAGRVVRRRLSSLFAALVVSR
jgi:hypothetical protein